VYPLGLIAPITILWRPLPQDKSTLVAATQNNVGTAQGKGKGKQSSGLKEKESKGSPTAPARTIWVWAHPSVFEEVYAELRTAVSFALESVKNVSTSADLCEVEMADLREQVNVFEIMGPKSSQVIKGAFRPILDDTREEFKKVTFYFKNPIYSTTLIFG
jgi:ribonuclease P/MRP protein subunit POP1